MTDVDREHALYGARVAVMDFTLALWRYGSIDRLELFASPSAVERVRGLVGAALAGDAAREAQVVVESL